MTASDGAGASGRLTAAQARAIALRSQGIGGVRRTATPSTRTSTEALRRTVERTHLLQIDSVSVFARAHHLPVYTRHGSWDVRALDRAARPGEERLLQEALAHEAAFTTDEVHRRLGFRRRAARNEGWQAVQDAARSMPDGLARIREVLAEQGPLSAAEISRALGDHQRGDGWGWRRTTVQWAVEHHFRTGDLECVGRSAQFERLYLPVASSADGAGDAAGDGAVLGGSDETDLRSRDEEDVAHLIALAARALGVAEASSLSDYFRIRSATARPAIQELIATGEVREVEVDLPGGTRRMLLHRDAPDPAPVRTRALVSPFDPVVFHRPRLASLFDVDYRIGIYTPAERRTTGYYSLLFLMGDLFPARVDLRADRARGVLEVRGVYREELPQLGRRMRRSDAAIARDLAVELRRAARWQQLDEVRVPQEPLAQGADPALTSALATALAGAPTDDG
ncbi:winged helix-turn-helix domain-containing protein [Brachybacterium sp. DNPG3]